MYSTDHELCSPANSNGSENTQEKNKALRMILNAPWWTRTHELHDEAEIEMIEEFLNRLKDNFHARTVVN